MLRAAATAPAAALLAVLVLVLLPLPASAATYSSLWGKDGNDWDPRGRLPDFSYAGYKYGTEALPEPPVTRSVLKFKRAGMTDTQAIKHALDWANKQRLTNKFIVLSIPPGTYTLTERLFIRRSRVVLRGAGAGKTTLYIPKSLYDVYGPNPRNRETGAYVTSDAFLKIEGTGVKGSMAATVVKFAAKGAVWVVVNKPSALKVGEYFDMWFTDIGGKFNNYMYDNLLEAPAKYRGDTRVKFTTKILAIRGNASAACCCLLLLLLARIKIERNLPYDINYKMNIVRFHERPRTVSESGIEGITFAFKWTWYPGHHLERGMNAVELSDVRDCWVRNIATINADNTVLMQGVTSSTIVGVTISASKTRANRIPNQYKERADRDGHWGIEFAHSFDVLVRRVVQISSLMHSVGTDSSGKWGVFADLKFRDGNLDLHRALSGPTLYTDIDVGLGTNALWSGGPRASGANAAAGTTWWNIRSKKAVTPNASNTAKPGDCSYGPVINIVNVNLIPAMARKICRTWLYERYVSSPANLYEAQYERRMRLAAAAASG
ncbi:hypothetical protein CHLNCDRAFT_133034 [Chlorella variabilis]|uniref:Pectate lyase superfamily protein domain-containing protein n=1 Tax=Chlorella variabilis TaxID=554065 RepID=E1Z273_CHLVA|nr:hypothetical protein CHLNCDRAFT_133034 [Chlorella variabilis]EFN59950.1 hypothetical protein CHLNCDRAFT_133034 [Chlorella variabilis]|eukprot:XP_005852052.1 hypothetical protein CHLNCDRAFT_133034 [Chlorella variabilis]